MISHLLHKFFGTKIGLVMTIYVFSLPIFSKLEHRELNTLNLRTNNPVLEPLATVLF